MDELISAYANDELSDAQREFVEEHLSHCPHCRETLAACEKVNFISLFGKLVVNFISSSSQV